MSNASDRIIGPLKDKLPDADSSDDLNDQLWDTADVSPDDEFTLEIQVDGDDTREAVVEEIEKLGISVGSEYGRTIRTRATAEEVFDIAEISDVQKVFENIPDRLHNTSEGVGVSNADTVQSNQNLTGSGVKAAIIDLSPNEGSGFWPESHTKYGNNVVDKIGSGADDGSYFVEQSELHGTGCTEIVYDMAPDADLVLCSYSGDDADGSISSMLKKLEQQHPDTAVVSISLGSAPTDRLDGLDGTSKNIDKFTTEGETISDPSNVGQTAERGRVVAISAGNEADGNTWHGQYSTASDGTMEFHNNEAYLEVQDAEPGVFIFANWDSWDESGQEYSVALYTGVTKNTAIASQSSSANWNYVQVPDGYSGDTLYFEVTKENATRDHEFDVWLWGNQSMSITKDTSARSISIPATAQDSETLTTAAIQATDFGLEDNAGDLKRYSSRGKTRDGRDGINISGPSRVSQTSEGYGTASSTQDPGYGFNGTSAAAPHVAGAATQLFEVSGVTHTDVAQAIKNTGAGIPDSNFSKSDTAVVGGGYLDVQAAYENITAAVQEPISQVDTSNPLGGDPQYNTPAVDSQHVYVGGLQNTFYALSRSDFESVSWTVDRASKPGLSDSSAHIWTDPSQNKVIFGSGQGDVYAVDSDDSSSHWKKTLGSAVTSTPTSYNGKIFVGTNDGSVYAFNGSDGNQAWSKSVSGGVYSNLVAHNGYLYVTTQSGTLAVFDTSNGAKQWTASHTEFGASSPEIDTDNGNVYVAADEVYAYNLGGTKSQQWSTSTFGGTAGSDPLYHSGSVYVGSADGNLYSYDTSNSGSENWSASTGDTIAGSPAINGNGDRIAVISMNGTLYLYDTSGTERTTKSVSGATDTRSTPVLDNGQLFLPVQDGTLRKFE